MSSWQCLSHCPCLAVVSTTAFIGDIAVEYSCELISADYRLTQSAEMIFWAVHHVEAESTCQTGAVVTFNGGEVAKRSLHSLSACT